MRGAVFALLLSLFGALPARADVFGPRSLQDTFLRDNGYFAGQMTLGLDGRNVRSASRFVDSVMALQLEPVAGPYPNAQTYDQVIYRNDVWGAGVGFYGRALGEQRAERFAGEFLSLLDFNAYRQMRLRRRLHASLEVDFYTGLRAYTELAGDTLVRREKTWHTGAAAFGGLRLDPVPHLRVLVQPGVAYTFARLGDEDGAVVRGMGRIEVQTLGRLVLGGSPWWITAKAYGRDDFFGRHWGVRAEVRPGDVVQLGLAWDRRWTEVGLHLWPLPMIELRAALTYFHDYRAPVVTLGMQLFWSGFGMPAFFQSAS